MNKSAIKFIDGLEIIDSRGNPTVYVEVRLEDGSYGEASVPSGASTGEHEAIELRDGDEERYRGKGVLRAVENVRKSIRQELVGVDATDQSKVDAILLELDGTPNKSNLGANAILGVSLAVSRAAAQHQKKELFEYLGDGQGVFLPVPLVNVINGGAHADNSLDIQEFMIVPNGAASFSDAVRISAEVFHALGGLLRNDGYGTGVGDEGGYAPRLESIELAFDFLIKAIERAGYQPGIDVALALDVAASEFAKSRTDGGYDYEFAKSQLGTFSATQLVALYEKWCSKYPIVSIEDGLSENDWAGWAELTARLGQRIQLVGDDLFVTNAERIKLGIQQKVANSVLVKVNQIGSLTETLAAMTTAANAGYSNVISHRSGETADSTISDIAVGLNTKQIKTGSMCRGERTAKYNRLPWIERKLGEQARYVDPFATR